MANMVRKWWHNAVVYQIYPRSFNDSNGDGIGDLNGVIEKLDYLVRLGIDVIWLSPVFKSPNDDNGYDVSDYRDIMDEFGTMADMEKLIAEANKHGIKILMDLVANHTSDEHVWFQEARRSRDNPYRDYYVWSDKPNELRSYFELFREGSAWEYDEATGQYYLRFFTKKQPDLNWANPRVRQEIWDMMNFWIDKGIGGFRMDVLELIGKEPEKMISVNGPKLHDYIREMNRETFGAKDLLTVGECWSADISEVKKYANPDGSEISMVFQFEREWLDHVPGREKWDLAPLPVKALKDDFVKWQNAIQDDGWNTLFWNNHDVARAVSRYGDDGRYRLESAKMLATLLYGLRGTPYLYQGEELGMTNVRFPSIDDYRDIETLNMYKFRSAKGYDKDDILRSIYAKGRDNARTPMQWSAADGAGFTGGTPWIGINPNHRDINAESQLDDPDSIFNYYRRLIALRKSMDVFIYGVFEDALPEHERIFAYTRTLELERGCEKLFVVANMGGETEGFELPEGFRDAEILIENYPGTPKALRPYEARIYHKKAE